MSDSFQTHLMGTLDKCGNGRNIEYYPALMRMVFRGGIDLDAEVEALLAVFRQHQFALFVQAVGNKTPVSPLLQLGLRGWISFFLEVCLQWGEHQDIPREQVVVLLEQSLRAIFSLDEGGNALSSTPAQTGSDLRSFFSEPSG